MSCGERSKFYSSRVWKETRTAYKKSVGGLCERCKKKGMIVPGETVHHKIYLTDENLNDLSISLDFGNLELVCRECHAAEHGNPKRYKVMADGSVVAV